MDVAHYSKDPKVDPIVFNNQVSVVSTCNLNTVQGTVEHPRYMARPKSSLRECSCNANWKVPGASDSAP